MLILLQNLTRLAGVCAVAPSVQAQRFPAPLTVAVYSTLEAPSSFEPPNVGALFVNRLMIVLEAPRPDLAISNWRATDSAPSSSRAALLRSPRSPSRLNSLLDQANETQR